jgi:hypothetical protein
MSYRPWSSLRNIGQAGAVLLVTLAGCQTYNPQPVTQADGSYIKLPTPSTKAAVWGTNPEAVQSLTTWLSKRGLILIDDIKINQIGSDNRLFQPGKPFSNADVLKVGKIAGAKQVIFVEADVTTWHTSGIETFFGQTPTIYTASVFIRALDAETGEISWNGKALSMDKFTSLTEGMHQLTCQALATAWGLRQPETTAAPTICPSGQNVMVSTEPPPTPTATAKTSESGGSGPTR